MEVKNLPGGKPISFKELAKPSPCIKPKEKTSRMRQGFNSVSIIFSTATKTMDNAIIGSIKGLGATMIFFILKASAMLWATVKADAW